MKTAVKITVLLAGLFLLTGTAFAINGGPYCDCYECTAYEADNPSVQYPFVGSVCIDEGNNSGYMCGGFDGVDLDMELSLFFGPMNDQGLAFNENCVAYFKTHGDDHYVANVISYCYGGRYIVRCNKTDVPCLICVSIVPE